ncbi:hypothetical protein [Longispora urticae]
MPREEDTHAAGREARAELTEHPDRPLPHLDALNTYLTTEAHREDPDHRRTDPPVTTGSG